MSSTPNPTTVIFETSQRLTFGWTDYLLFVGLLGLSLLIGIYFGFFSKQDSASEYLFGGRHMSYMPVATSILARYFLFLNLLTMICHSEKPSLLRRKISVSFFQQPFVRNNVFGNPNWSLFPWSWIFLNYFSCNN